MTGYRIDKSEQVWIHPTGAMFSVSENGHVLLCDPHHIPTTLMEDSDDTEEYYIEEEDD